jgi:hypothetical protein
MAPLYPGNADRLVGTELTRHQRLRITAMTLMIQPEPPLSITEQTFGVPRRTTNTTHS